MLSGNELECYYNDKKISYLESKKVVFFNENNYIDKIHQQINHYKLKTSNFIITFDNYFKLKMDFVIFILNLYTIIVTPIFF
jgi:hypothetical protein